MPKTEENTNGNRDNAGTIQSLKTLSNIKIDHGDPDETDSDNDGYELHPLLAGSVTPNEPGKQKFGPVQKSKQNPIENKTPSLDLNSLVQQHHSESVLYVNLCFRYAFCF